MSSPLSGAAAEAAAPSARAAPLRAAVYRAVWRWHFLAGLVCLPILVLLAGTGALYLFKDEINAGLFGARTRVAPAATAPLDLDRLIFNAAMMRPGAEPVGYTDPRDPGAAAVIALDSGGRRLLAYLDPYRGDVLATTERDGEAMMLVRRLHSLTLLGPAANVLVEVVAGFAVVLVVTGLYLWWPRGDAPALALRGGPRRRLWWRDLHALTGCVAGAGLLFLALTGLPWSAWWGQELRAWSNAAGLGQPRALWAERARSQVPAGSVLDSAGWALEDAPLPRSGPADADPIGPGQAAAILRGLGMPRGFEMALPVGPDGVYAASLYPRDVAQQRMVSLDRYSGRVLSDVRFADLGIVARLIQYGIAIHKGEYWGRANQLAMLAICLATLLLALTGATMWWKRRPRGSLGVPPPPRDPGSSAAVTLLMLGLGALFPLTGLAIVLLIGLDLAVQRLRRAA